MKLRKYEIDAIVAKVIEGVIKNTKIPDFSKEIQEIKLANDELQKFRDEIENLNNKINSITKKFPVLSNYRYRYSSITSKDIKEYLVNNFKSKTQPNSFDIQNDIVLSSNKDLSILVDELVSKYLK